VSVTIPFGYPYGRCRWFPWLPRWWWTGLYGQLTPYAAIPKEQEKAMLEQQRKWIEETLALIKERLDEMKKEEEE
jgi:hypothetical protein